MQPLHRPGMLRPRRVVQPVFIFSGHLPDGDSIGALQRQNDKVPNLDAFGERPQLPAEIPQHRYLVLRVGSLQAVHEVNLGLVHRKIAHLAPTHDRSAVLNRSVLPLASLSRSHQPYRHTEYLSFMFDHVDRCVPKPSVSLPERATPIALAPTGTTRSRRNKGEWPVSRGSRPICQSKTSMHTA